MNGYEILWKWRRYFIGKDGSGYFIGINGRGYYVSLRRSDLAFWRRRPTKSMFWKELLSP